MRVTDQEAICGICSHCNKVFTQKSLLAKHEKGLQSKALSKPQQPPSSREQTNQLSPTRGSGIKVPCEKERSKDRFIDITESDPTKASDSVSDDESAISEVVFTAPTLKRSAVCPQTPNEVAWNERLTGESLRDGTGGDRLEKGASLTTQPRPVLYQHSEIIGS
jgi:hypothetical protein